MKKIYSKEENIQILISLLKEHNIKKVIINPGTTNISFVATVQSDDFFEIYSCVDERSAAYMACGLAEESGEPVVLTCTGATASRNYMPGLTEAYYNKLPVIAITATQHLGRVGQNVPQVLDRSIQLKDIVKKSIQLQSVYTEEDRWACNLNVNDVLLECRRNGGGPVHINMVTTYSNEFVEGEVPKQKIINRYKTGDALPKIDNKYNKVAIFIGNHLKFTEILTKEIEQFCEKYNAVVLCDHTSNYNGKYKILGNLVCNQSDNKSDVKNIDLLIDIGNISGSYMFFNANEVWRVNPDGEIRDTYKRIKNVFAMYEEQFFSEYNKLSNNVNTEYYENFNNEDNRLRNKMDKIDLPFSNIWIAKNTINKLQNNSIVHLAILNTLRSWNYFKTDKNIKFYSNTGGFGIDGIMSTAIGTSLCTDKLVYCFIGDLAFFYDLNSIGNKNVKSNLRILLINNGCGTEFHNYNHRAVAVSNSNDLSLEYFAADGHFGNKSTKLVKHYAEDLGFDYISASNKDEFSKNIDLFTKEDNDKPIIFEVFTNPEDESNALKLINNIELTAKGIIKKIVGNKGIEIAKKMLGR